jgi:uncharacterized protein YjiS (DUF1127 family)
MPIRSTTDTAPAARQPALRRILRLAGRLAARLDTWAARSRQRRALSELTDDALRDIGLSRYDVVRESTKPFWRP